MTRGWDGAVAVEEGSGYWGIKTYPGHFYLGQWPVLRVDRRALHGVQRGVKTVDHLGTAAASCEYSLNGRCMQGEKEGEKKTGIRPFQRLCICRRDAVAWCR